MTSFSLRSRLLLATVTLVALGLLIADFATFALLRSQLLGRVDEQLRGSRGVAARLLTGPEQFGGLDFGRRPSQESPPVTVVELLDSSGRVVASRSFGFGDVDMPQLPGALPGSTGNATPERIFSAGSAGPFRYRVIATALSDGGTLVVAQTLGDVDATLRKLVLVESIVTALVLAGVAGIALWLVRLGLRPLTEMEVAADDIAQGNLSRRVDITDEHTEVGRLGRALNVMLERIEAAFAERRTSEDRLRRFVADASHELRTPLTSIRGYAELFRHGADRRPEDLEKSMRRIEEESARMGTLVDELLLLARLDQGPQLERTPVDITTLARDAVEDARAVQPARPISFEANGRAIIVEGDEARLRMIAANLLSNALSHTPLETPVRVAVATDDSNAVLEVADEGPGLDGDEAEHVFDRFFRVDEARSRHNGGVGLGLAIVAAVAKAHGGAVRLDSSPGAGARFTVLLPLAADDPAAAEQ
ncbi:MAG: sensor histidine kinase [Actinomycetota bacterium]|nr:HAMP domain-containing histidine kinase [Actinomycetota bacterium]